MPLLVVRYTHLHPKALNPEIRTFSQFVCDNFVQRLGIHISEFGQLCLPSSSKGDTTTIIATDTKVETRAHKRRRVVNDTYATETTPEELQNLFSSIFKEVHSSAMVIDAASCGVATPVTPGTWHGSGATLTGGIILELDPDKGSYAVMLANVGDSGALLVQKEGVVLPLATMHTASQDELELLIQRRRDMNLENPKDGVLVSAAGHMCYENLKQVKHPDQSPTKKCPGKLAMQPTRTIGDFVCHFFA